MFNIGNRTVCGNGNFCFHHLKKNTVDCSVAGSTLQHFCIEKYDHIYALINADLLSGECNLDNVSKES